MAWFLTKFAHTTNEIVGQMKSDLFASIKQLTKGQSGELVVLEIGAGTGANFKYLPENSKVIALEPNEHCIKYLQDSASESPNLSLDIITSSVEDLTADLNDESVDAVIGTYVLCSVENVDAALQEVKRVLKKNGRFYFLEHVRDQHYNSWTHIFQRIMVPVMQVIADCDCAKSTWTFIDRAGFSELNYRRIPGPKQFPPYVRPHLYGHVTK